MRRDRYLLLPVLAAVGPLLAAGPIRPIAAAQAARPDKEETPPTVKLVLHPAAEPRPALKYHLFPPLVDRRPGNAAVLYGKVTAEQFPFFTNRELWETIYKWLDTPLEEFPQKEARGPLSGSPFKFLDRAARCEYVDWQLPIREETFYEILLPELQQTRQFGRMLAAKARLHVAEGDLEKAVHTLQTGYALARHVGQGQTLINGLVGIAIARMMSNQVETLIQQPGAPNLYWALTHLPDPLVDMRPGFEAEWAMIYLSYPELRDLENKQDSPEQWRERLNKLTGSVFSFTERAPEIRCELLTTALALKGYPVAKQALIERGYEPAEVEAMPVPKVILLHTMQTYEELRDDVFKWFSTPYWRAREGINRAEQQVRASRDREVIPLANVFLPAMRAARQAGALGERTIALLRVIEAIRLYGAAHDAKLPEKLEDINEVPVPIDPVRSKPFVYHLEGGTAVLEAPPLPGMSPEHGLRYEITFAPKGQ